MTLLHVCASGQGKRFWYPPVMILRNILSQLNRVINWSKTAFTRRSILIIRLPERNKCRHTWNTNGKSTQTWGVTKRVMSGSYKWVVSWGCSNKAYSPKLILHSIFAKISFFHNWYDWYSCVLVLAKINFLCLTHWGRVTHICVGKLIIIGSDNGLSPGRRQAIISTNAGILLIRPLGTNFNENLIGIQTFSFKKMYLKMSSEKWRPFCLGLNVLN